MTREIVRRTYLCARRYIFIRTACLPHIFIFYCLFSSWFVFVLLHTERTQHIELRDHLETIFFTVCSTDVWHIFFLLLLILYQLFFPCIYIAVLFSKIIVINKKKAFTHSLTREHHAHMSNERQNSRREFSVVDECGTILCRCTRTTYDAHYMQAKRTTITHTHAHMHTSQRLSHHTHVEVAVSVVATYEIV